MRPIWHVRNLMPLASLLRHLEREDVVRNLLNACTLLGKSFNLDDGVVLLVIRNTPRPKKPNGANMIYKEDEKEDWVKMGNEN